MKKLTLSLAICFLLVTSSLMIYALPHAFLLLLTAVGIAFSVFRVINYFVDGE